MANKFSLGDKVKFTDQFKQLPSVVGIVRDIDTEPNGLVLYEIAVEEGPIKWEFITGEAHEFELIDG